MCVFCYGFSPLVTKLHETYKNDLEFVFLPAGIWREGQEKIATPMFAKNMKKSIQRVGKMTGQSYGEAFIKYLSTKPTLNSYLGAKAINTVIACENLDPMIYLNGLYDLTFIQGKNISEVKLFVDLAVSLGIKKEVFLEHFNSEEIATITEEKIALLVEKEMTSFPTMVLEKEGELFTYPLNYVSYEALEKWLKSYL